MAVRNNRSPVPPAVPPAAPQPEPQVDTISGVDDFQDDPTPDGDVFAFTDSIPEDARIVVYRVLDGKKGLVGSFTPSADLAEEIGRRFGGGVYYYRTRDARGTWMGSRPGFKASGDFVLDPRAFPAPAPAASASSAPVSSSGDSVGLSAILGMFQASQQMSQAMMLKMMESNTQILIATMNGQKGAALDIPSLLKAAREFASPVSPAAKLEDTLALVQRIQDMTPAAASSGEGGGGLMSELKPFLPLLAGALMQQTTPSAPARAPVTAQVVPAGPPRAMAANPQPASAIGNPAPEVDPVMFEKQKRHFMLKQVAEQLLPLAETDSPVDLYADVLIHQAMSKGVDLPAIRTIFVDEKLVEELSGVVPGVARYAQWFRDLRSEVVQHVEAMILEEKESGDGDGVNSPGDSGT